ncbi:MAG: class I SAM-dependent methyltransferase [Promethearchaeota archaeon]
MVNKYAKADWTDNDRVQRMAKTYSIRYDEKFWKAIQAFTEMKSRYVVADFGCGPGLLLADIANRFKAHTAIALDESAQMLAMAEVKLNELTNLEKIEIQQVNFDDEQVQVKANGIDFAFSGFMLHEVAKPNAFVSSVFRLVATNGLYVVYDFVSGNEERFVNAMSQQGMSEERARKRYPHMCKHSADDIVRILETSGFSECRALTIDEVRAVVVGLKR